MVTDMAGNVDTNCLSEDHRFTIDTDAPEVNVAFMTEMIREMILPLSQAQEQRIITTGQKQCR